MKKFFTIAAIAASTLISCSDNEVCPPPQGTDEIKIFSVITDVTQTPLLAPQTKTTIGGTGGTTASWAEGDKIGVFSTQSTPASDNNAFTVAGISSTPVWTPTTAIYWKDGTTAHKFLAYYPHASGNTAAAVKLPNIGTQNGTLDPASDFLISSNLNSTGVARSANPIGLTFTHALSLIEFNIVLGNGLVTGTTLTSAVLASSTSGDKLFTTDGTSTIALSSGVITPGTLTSNTATITPASAPILSATATPIRVLLLPGTFTAPTLTLNLSESSVAIAVPAASLVTATFAPGTKYIYTVTVSRTAISISNPTITPWADGGTTSINPGI